MQKLGKFLIPPGGLFLPQLVVLLAFLFAVARPYRSGYKPAFPIH